MKQTQTIALCALLASCITGPAQAQSRFDIQLSGDAYFEIGLVSQSNDRNLRSTEARNRFRLTVVPLAKADNGLEYGANLRLRSALGSRAADIDRSYLFSSGSFGTVRLGVTPGFDGEISHLANGTGRPIAYLPFGLYDHAAAWVGPAGGAQGTDPTTGRYTGGDFRGGVGGALQPPATLMWPWLNADAGATKILYASPRFAGLQVGGSYTPRNDSSNTDISRAKTGSTPAAQFTGNFQDIVEVGANYKATLGPVKATLSAAYMGGKAIGSGAAADSFKDLRGYIGGFRFEYAGFSLGGDYLNYGKSGQNARYAHMDDSWTWQIGAQYVTGPYVLGAAYIRTEDPGQVNRPGKRTADIYEVGAGYTVAPGLRVQLQYDYFDTRSDKAVTLASGSPDDRAHVLLARTMVAF
ncbi:porin (plasmid) [Azospirillum humicireducens]|uniref:Porin n=1 Tax=Azospirillum humicireducens TaxID=1226968 RepID=A0A2R4VUP0_9PROT|nr:porin [Azospirillum humicireducens]AWB08101.1 porin [Azospirillum humicireducens]